MSSRFERDREPPPRTPFGKAYVDRPFFSDVNSQQLPSSSTLPNRKSRSEFRNQFTTDPRPSSAGRRIFAENSRSFSPSARRSGEDILSRLKAQLREESGMFSKSPDWQPNPFRRADDSEDWAQKSFDDMKSRQPMFRMPNWMSEDDDMSNLTSRMSQAPHFATMGNRNASRGGPWRERRHSGGSAMSGTSEDDSVDSSHRQDQQPPVSIPIRIEAEAPPGMMPQPAGPISQEIPLVNPDTKVGWSSPQNIAQQPVDPPLMCTGQLRKQPHYASRTSPAVDTLSQEEVPRDSRCASAPPNIADPLNQHNPFVSKTKITPQNSNDQLPFKNSPVFNNVPKPFVSLNNPSQTRTPPIQEEQQSDVKQPSNNDHPQQTTDENTFQHTRPQYEHQPEFSDPQQQQRDGHKSSIIRNIPIFIEGRDKDFVNQRNAQPQQSNREQQQRQSHWDQSNQNPKQNQGQDQWDHQSSHWDDFERPQWDVPFGKKANFGFPSDPFFEFPKSQRSNFKQDPQFQNFQRQPSPPKQTQRQPSPPKQTQRQPSPPKQTQRQPSPPKQTYHQPSPPQQTQRQPSPPKSTSNVDETQIPNQSPIDIKMEKIVKIGNSVIEYVERAKVFQGKKTDKEYLYLDEMLTRALLQLDNIDPDGCDDIRQARRTLIKGINESLMSIERISNEAKVTAASDTTSNIETGIEKENGEESPEEQKNACVESDTKIISEKPLPLSANTEEKEDHLSTKS